jgi:glycosyltransferase involved in cell wall biosynthesis
MHVLHILDHSPVAGGGVAAHLAALADALSDSGDELTLAFPLRREWHDELSQSATVLLMPEIRQSLYTRFPRAVRAICRERRVDLLHLHFSFALPFALALTPTRWRLPVIYHWHNPPKVLIPRTHTRRTPVTWIVESLRKGGSTKIAQFTDQRVISRHVAVSSEIQALLIDHRWATRQKVLRLPNALVNLPARFRPSDSDGREGLVFVSVANFRPQKDHVTLLRAFQIVVREFPSAILRLVGDGGTRAPMEHLAEDLSIADHVQFSGSVDDPSDEYSRADIFILSTHYEGQGLVLLEAMGHGLPVIATDLASIRETIHDGVEGVLSRPADATHLAAAMLRLASDRTLRARLGEAGRNRVCKDFSARSWVRCLRSLYEDLVSV